MSRDEEEAHSDDGDGSRPFSTSPPSSRAAGARSTCANASKRWSRVDEPRAVIDEAHVLDLDAAVQGPLHHVPLPSLVGKVGLEKRVT